jgi:DNA-binding transcriptional regulator YbjK
LEVNQVAWKGSVDLFKMFYVVLSDGEDDSIIMEIHPDMCKQLISKIIGKKKTLILGAKVHLLMLYYVVADKKVSTGKILWSSMLGECSNPRM